MIKIQEFPGCCNAMIMFNFGGTRASLFKNPKHDENMRDAIEKAIHRFGYRMLVATTNDQQVEANKLLEEYGFKRTEFMSKYMHPETTFAMWWREPTCDKKMLEFMLNRPWIKEQGGEHGTD